MLSTSIDIMYQHTSAFRSNQMAIPITGKQWQEAAARSSGKKQRQEAAQEAAAEAVPACIVIEQVVTTTATMTVVDNEKTTGSDSGYVQHCDAVLRQRQWPKTNGRRERKGRNMRLPKWYHGQSEASTDSGHSTTLAMRCFNSMASSDSNCFAYQ